MPALQRAARGLSAAGAWVASGLLVLMVAHIVLEMVLRYGFDTSTFVVGEFVGYWVAILTFLGLGHALNSGTLIRVNVVVQFLPPRARRWLELVVVALTLGLMLYLAWFFWLAAERFAARGTVSNTVAAVPMWLPTTAVMAGMLVFAVQLLAYGLAIMAGGRPVDEPGEGTDRHVA